MPAYDPSPFKPSVRLLVPGQNTYLLGSYAQDQSPSRFAVTSVAIATNVATVVGTMTEGAVPVAGSLVSIRGTQTAGGFNVTNVALATATFVNATSQITVTFALVHADVATTADSGLAIVPQPEVAEAIATGTASIACTPQNNETFLQMGRQVSVTIIGTGVYQLQGANFDQASEYTSLGVAADNAVTQFGPFNHRFYRILATTGGTAVARISG